VVSVSAREWWDVTTEELFAWYVEKMREGSARKERLVIVEHAFLVFSSSFGFFPGSGPY